MKLIGLNNEVLYEFRNEMKILNLYACLGGNEIQVE